ncbi:MAG: amidohydrolase family protein, partial [Balneolaceae bacterium]|nr:amidohydrolase family protein [Balneolaceae bacterium]
MSNAQNRREFLQKLGAFSLAAGAGSVFPGVASGSSKKEGREKIYVGNPNQQKLKIYNGKVITPFRVINEGTVVVTDGKISEVSVGNVEVPGATEIDAQGNFISPGFIDIHIHGGGGSGFLDGSVDAFLEVARAHSEHGTTAMFPTALSGDKEVLLRNIDLYEKAAGMDYDGAQFLGLFLEGPYYSMDHKGAQDPRYIRDP